MSLAQQSQGGSTGSDEETDWPGAGGQLKSLHTVSGATAAPLKCSSPVVAVPWFQSSCIRGKWAICSHLPCVSFVVGCVTRQAVQQSIHSHVFLLMRLQMAALLRLLRQQPQPWLLVASPKFPLLLMRTLLALLVPVLPGTAQPTNGCWRSK